MSKLAVAGIIFVIFGFMAIGYSGIQSFMGQGATFKTVLVIDLFDPDFIDQMDAVSWHGFQRAADFLLDLPVYVVCFVTGGILLVISSFFWRR